MTDHLNSQFYFLINFSRATKLSNVPFCQLCPNDPHFNPWRIKPNAIYRSLAHFTSWSSKCVQKNHLRNDPCAHRSLCGVQSALSRVKHVGQFLEAGSPVVEVVVVLVSVRAAWSNGAEAACQRALSFIVVDQGCVVRRHVRVVVCSVEALKEETLQALDIIAQREKCALQLYIYSLHLKTDFDV